MNMIRNLRLSAGVTQQELALAAGTSQSTIAAYETGAKSPTLRTMENLAKSLRKEMVVNYMPQLTREDKRSLAFHRAIADILLKTSTPTIARAKRNLEKLVVIHPGAVNLLDRWKIWLELPVNELITNLLDPFPLAREMRHVSPFSGILSTQERTQILQQFRQVHGL